MIKNRESLKKILATAITGMNAGRIGYKPLYSLKDNGAWENEFLFFIKPEITMKSSERPFDQILEMLFAQLEKFGLVPTDMRILNAQYLKQYNIIAQHYGIINAVSASPLKSMTDDAKEKFRSVAGKSIKEVRVLGSLEMSGLFSDFNATSLDYLWQNAKTEKLAGGTYVAKVMIDGEEIYLINGFHPRQLEHYVRPGRCIITMTLSGNLSWKDARNGFIGATNPKDALPGSLRNLLLQNREIFGLHAVSSSWNGFHLSAGPVEGLVELMRYTSDFSKNEHRSLTDFRFGRMLAAKFSDEAIGKITGNASIDTGSKKTSVFDLTEEKDSKEAIEILGNYFAKKAG
jgi:hypothetical protein